MSTPTGRYSDYQVTDITIPISYSHSRHRLRCEGESSPRCVVIRDLVPTHVVSPHSECGLIDFWFVLDMLSIIPVVFCTIANSSLKMRMLVERVAGDSTSWLTRFKLSLTTLDFDLIRCPCLLRPLHGFQWKEDRSELSGIQSEP